MMHIMRTSRILTRRGSAMMVALALALLATFTVMILAKTLLDHTRMNQRKRELNRAFYAAEAGINQVIHWANYPDTYPDSAALFQTDEEGNFTALTAALAGGAITIDSDLLPAFEDEDHLVSKVVTLTLMPPESGDPVTCLLKILAVGESPNGIRRTVMMYADVNPLGNFNCPAALVSYDTTHTQGDVGVHWGEIWSKGDVDTSTKPKTPTHGEDEWFKIRTEGVLNFHNSWNTKKWYGADDALAEQPLADESGSLSTDYGEVFYQHQTLDFPTFDYEEYKAAAIASGRYYSTDASGDIYRDGIEDADHRVTSFDAEFDSADGGVADLVFIDTIDGNPPAADGSNLATLFLHGHGTQFKGIFYLAANLDMTGIGNPPSLEATRPDGGQENLSKVFCNGILYASGYVNSRGNASVYGSLLAGMGYRGTGTPDVYYNDRLRDGIPFALASKLKSVLYKAY